jgi:NAD dependent epimerase/dehydratase
VKPWDGRRVLITGAGGFIGSHLAERLVELGASVRAFVEYSSLGSWGWLDESPVRGELDVRSGDVRDLDSISGAAAGSDTVFHLAALIAIPYSYEAPRSYVETNVVGTINVLRAAAAAQAERIVHTSTSEVYGTARYVPIDEDHPLQGQSPYSASKIAADKMVEAFNRSFGMPVSTLRPFNTYGPRQSARAVIPTAVTQLLNGGAVALGNLSPTRDFTYVTDTVEAFVRIADCSAAVGRVVNVGTGREISIGDLVDRIERVVDRDGGAVVRDEERVRPAASEVERLCANADLARELFGWEPTVSLDEGLAATAEWIAQNMDRYRVGAYTV